MSGRLGALSLTTWSLPQSQPFRKRHQGSGNSSTRWAPRSKLCSTTQTSTSPPPQASMVANAEAGLGWNCSLGKTARFAGLKAVPPVIPHRSTELGVQAERKDRPSQSTHAVHAPAADQGDPSSNRWHSSPFPRTVHGSNSTVPDQSGQSRSYLNTLGPKAGILEALGQYRNSRRLLFGYFGDQDTRSAPERDF